MYISMVKSAKVQGQYKTKFKCLGIEVRETVLLSGTIKWIEKIFDMLDLPQKCRKYIE